MRRLLPCDGHLMAKLSGYIVMLCGEYSHLEFVFAGTRERVKRTQSERLNTNEGMTLRLYVFGRSIELWGPQRSSCLEGY